MDFLAALKFEWRCLKLAILDSISTLNLPSAILGSIVFLIVCVIATKILGWDYIVSDVTTGIVFGVAGLAVTALLILLFHLFVVPSKIVIQIEGMIRERDNDIVDLNNRIEQLNNPQPNITIKELFDYIREYTDIADEYPELANEDVIFKIGKSVGDSLSIGRLYIWARESDQYDGMFSKNSLKKLDFDNWNDFSFTFNFLNYDPLIVLSGEAEEARKIDGIYRGNQVKTTYLDLQFNYAQMKSIWPER